MDSPEKLKHCTPNGDATNHVKADHGTTLQELDALIVGAGFAGVYQLKRLRELGYKVLLVESGSGYGGVWYWNRYPGARVDTANPQYQFSDPALWKDWVWSQKFPGGAELRAYFDHVAKRWDLRKDTKFNTFVEGATWDEDEAKWIVRAESGEKFRVKYILLNTGFASKRYIPDWKGMNNFEGTIIHPSYWPHEEPNLSGKKIAIIGTGATATQLIQDLSKTASQLTVFQRTPNTALPMRQVVYNATSQHPTAAQMTDSFAARTSSFAGFDYNFLPRSTFGDTPEERLKTYEDLWSQGGFAFWLATYDDMLFDNEANREAYVFWRDKTRTRIKDSKIADILAPMEQEYAFGCKRIPLENGYFEVFNEGHVKLVDLKSTPIVEFTQRGIKTTEEEMDFDYIICATGYDSLTGGLTQIDIKGSSENTLKEYWENGVRTYLGMSVAGFPNLLYTYGPQAPSNLCNGPTCAELQGEWVVKLLNYMRDNGLKRIEAEAEREKEWKEKIVSIANTSLLPTVKSWYMGANIPGKTVEPLVYLGGLPKFYKTLNEVASSGYSGFILS